MTRICEQTKKPVVTLDGSHKAPTDAAVEVRAFIDQHLIKVLNVAGLRETSHPGASRYANELVRAVLEAVGTKPVVARVRPRPE